MQQLQGVQWNRARSPPRLVCHPVKTLIAPLMQSGFFAFYVTNFVVFVAYFIKSATSPLSCRPKAVET
jgi:hypothetical protein